MPVTKNLQSCRKGRDRRLGASLPCRWGKARRLLPPRQHPTADDAEDGHRQQGQRGFAGRLQDLSHHTCRE
jgi:hypothetical protein